MKAREVHVPTFKIRFQKPITSRYASSNIATQSFMFITLWTPTDLVLKAQMLLQLAPPTAVIITELALVGFDLSVLLQVQLQRLVAGACEGAFVASEHQALKVARQLGAADLQRTHALLWRRKRREGGGLLGWEGKWRQSRGEGKS